MYRIIARANDVLRNVPDMSISGSVKNRAIGQARFYRGFSYLWLAPWYGDNGVNGGIPIVTEKTPTAEIDQPRPTSVLANYDMIIEDMRAAADLLPICRNGQRRLWSSSQGCMLGICSSCGTLRFAVRC